jgi:hypothetical protein
MMKKPISKIPGLSFEIKETGSTKHFYVVHDGSGLPVVSFISVTNPATLTRIANKELQHPTYWTQSADELSANLLTARVSRHTLLSRDYTSIKIPPRKEKAMTSCSHCEAPMRSRAPARDASSF